MGGSGKGVAVARGGWVAVASGWQWLGDSGWQWQGVAVARGGSGCGWVAEAVTVAGWQWQWVAVAVGGHASDKVWLWQ
jgi:hypothetical protein